MGVMDKTINTYEILKSLLAKAFWVESQMEHTSEWLGYLEVEEHAAKDVLFQISNESVQHKTKVLEVINNFKNFNVDETIKELNLETPNINFTGKLDLEIFQSLIKTEQFALDIYTKILDATDPELINEIWTGDNPDDFFSTFTWLVEQEKEHIRLLDPFSYGHIERIL